MFKRILLSLFLLSSSVSALGSSVEEVFNKKEQETYDNLGKSIPLAKSLPDFLEDSNSIQKSYFELKDSFEFNRSTMKYYLENTENFQGYSSSKELFFHIPELTGIYNDLKRSGNAVTRFRLDKKYKETLKGFSDSFDMNYFKDKIYYSEIPLKGTFPYDFEKGSKTLLFSDYKPTFPAIYLTCFPDGNIIASFNGNKYQEEKVTIPSFVTNTPIILQVSEEIKEYIKYRASKYGENLCERTITFDRIEDGEIFEGFSNNKANTYLGFFTIDTSVTGKPYLVGKLSHMGFFVMDTDYYHMPFNIIGGNTFDSEINVEDIPDLVLDKLEGKGAFLKTFLESKFSYSFSDFFIRGITDKKQVNLIKNNTNLHVIYDYEILNDEIIFTLNKIVRDAPDYFPLKFRIVKEKDTEEGTVLSVYTLYNYAPFIYIKETLDLKAGVVVDWKRILEK
tara:strand:- start:2582 stop:3928 length:1347 start_codon:yes stop_codon:yes gene_type:complete